MGTTHKVLDFTPEASQTVVEMMNKCHTIQAWYGEGHPKTVAAWRSLALVMGQMIGLQGRIARDGDLSLTGSAFIYYGVIWFGDKNADKHADTGEALIGAPETGTWSVHS